MRFDARFHRSFIAGLRYNIRFAIKRTSFVFMHEAVEVARGGAAAGLRKELLMPGADARQVPRSSIKVGDRRERGLTPRHHMKRVQQPEVTTTSQRPSQALTWLHIWCTNCLYH
jgi:hypothetical protein